MLSPAEMRERQQTDGFKWYTSHIMEAMESASMTSQKGWYLLKFQHFKIRLNKITNIYTLSLGELR